MQSLFPPPSPEVMQQAYNTVYYGEGKYKFKGAVGVIFRFYQTMKLRSLRKYIASTGRILDVGCGTGDFAVAATQAGYEVEATEISAQSASRPQERGLAVHVGDLAKIHLPESSFDVIVLWHVLEHIQEPHEALEVVHALLKPDGKLVVAVPNTESVQARQFGPHWFHYDQPRHLHNYDPGSLGFLLAKSKFDGHVVSTWDPIQNIYGFAQSFLNSIFEDRNRAYEVLKGNSRNIAAFQRVFQIVLIMVVLIPAGIAALLESAIGRGGCLLFIASKSDLKVK